MPANTVRVSGAASASKKWMNIHAFTYMENSNTAMPGNIKKHHRAKHEPGEHRREDVPDDAHARGTPLSRRNLPAPVQVRRNLLDATSQHPGLVDHLGHQVHAGRSQDQRAYERPVVNPDHRGQSAEPAACERSQEAVAPDAEKPAHRRDVRQLPSRHIGGREHELRSRLRDLAQTAARHARASSSGRRRGRQHSRRWTARNRI